MDKALTIAFDWLDEKAVAEVKSTICPQASNIEFALFLQMGRSTGLNPWKKEIWLIPGKQYFSKKYGREVTQPALIMVGINGYWAIANKHEQFDGYEEGLVRDDGELVKACENYIGAWCRVYRKDRKYPHEAIVYLSEYSKASESELNRWSKAPRQMIVKVAESVALRKAFPTELNGTFTEEEIPEEEESQESAIEAPPARMIEWLYNLEAVPEEKRRDAVEYCRQNGATWDDDRYCYASNKRLARLDAYQIKTQEAA